jgi:acyl-CoA thioesterase FadM
MSRGSDEPALDPALGIRVPYRVRFDEATPSGTVRASTLLRYAQDVAWIHSDRLGFDRSWYADRGLTWLVRSALVVVEGPVLSGDALGVETRITGYRRAWARRRTSFLDAAGGRTAWAYTDWVIIDRRGRPTRVPEAIATLSAEPPPSFEPIRVPSIEAPGSAVATDTRVRRSDLDPLGHVNNAAYLDLFEEAVAALPDGATWLDAVPRAYRIEYLQAAEPYDRLRAQAWPIGDPRPEVHGTGPAGPSGARYRLATDAGVELARATLVLDAPTG